MQLGNDDELPKNCIVLFDDNLNSVLKFILGFISFKQPNFERTQIFMRKRPDYNHIVFPFFIKSTPSVQDFEYLASLKEENFETILRRDGVQVRNEVDSAIVREAIMRHALCVKNQPTTLAKDLNKFTN